VGEKEDMFTKTRSPKEKGEELF